MIFLEQQSSDQTCQQQRSNATHFDKCAYIVYKIWTWMLLLLFPLLFLIDDKEFTRKATYEMLAWNLWYKKIYPDKTTHHLNTLSILLGLYFCVEQSVVHTLYFYWASSKAQRSLWSNEAPSAVRLKVGFKI